MNKRESFELLLKEYLDKVKLTGCDGCIAEHYCISHDLIDQSDCVEKLKSYLRGRKTTINKVE